MEKLRRVIYLLFIVFAETVLLNLFFGKEYTVTSEIETVVFPKLNLPLEGISSALVSTVTIYILGNKGIGFTKNIDRTGGERNSETPWANEHKENIIVEDDNSK